MPENYDFRIIIIDDNPEIHEDFIKILTTSDQPTNFDSISNLLFNRDKSKLASSDQPILLPQFKIDTATQGKAGVERIQEAINQGKPYALAFVDIRMPPGWDGIETIKHIWKLDKDMQIVICTAYSDYSWEETVAELGQSDNLLILKKPFDYIAVRQLACALTRKWKLMQESQVYTQSLEQSVQKRTEELHFQATHDSLTGLPNRVLLHDRLQQSIRASERDHSSFAVFFFDLDRFKLINDSLSHEAGDELLKSLTTRLQAIIRGTDTIARLGGDEFVMIVNKVNDTTSISAIAKNVLEAVKQPFYIGGYEFTVTASIGIAIYPKDGTRSEELLRNADTGMYCAKAAGANQYKFYSEKMNSENIERLELEAELRHAIENNELYVCFQPEINVKENKLMAVEALLRWNHPKKGEILPTRFIPLAEDTGLIVQFGEWVLREACKQIKAWQDKGLPHIRVSVNVTSQQLRQVNFVQTVKDILKETGLEPKYLELELTENVIINNIECLKTISELKDLGIQFAVDDFGTGYSSLNYLRNVPLDRLKIDRTFVQNIRINRGDEVLIHAIIAMAKSLNLEVLAEGVETLKQLNFLKSQHCTEIQGYYFSKPLKSGEMEEILADSSKIKNISLKD